ncbi:MAG TPA: hypothetical protein VH700_08440 [Gemmatimonadales bacterium]
MSQERWEVPELGPSLGRLTDPPQPSAGPLGVRLDDIRLKLVTGVFELAGAARSFAAAGDAVGAAASLNRVAWLALWEQAVAASAERLTATVNARLEEAAAESRYPRRMLRKVRFTPADARAIAARLGGGGAPFVAALDELEQAAHGIATAAGRERAVAGAWRAALAAVARRLEAAWLALEEAAEREQVRWQADVRRVHAWRMPRWPLWLITALVLGGAIYLGLVLGGYVPVPPILEGFADYWWSRM